MFSISDTLINHFLNDVFSKEIILRFPDDEISDIGSDKIVSESFELKNSIMDDNELVLGGCISSEMKIKIFNVSDKLEGKKVVAYLKVDYFTTLYPSSNLFPSKGLKPGHLIKSKEYALFTGFVDSVSRQGQNRNISEIVAYDSFYELSKIKANSENYSVISDYYTHGTTKIYLSEFVLSFLLNFPTSYSEFNDYEYLKFDDKSLMDESKKSNDTLVDLAKSYFELNSSFGFINSQGNVKAVDIYNKRKNGRIDQVIESYAELEVEEYETAPITKIVFPYQKDKQFYYGTASESTSVYISDNSITKWCSDISKLVTNFYVKNSAGTVLDRIFYDTYKYRPFTAKLFNYWWLEVGDYVQIKTGYEDMPYFNSFIFSKTIKGINSMRVTIEAKGTKFLGKEK